MAHHILPNHLHTLIQWHPISPDADGSGVVDVSCVATVGADLFTLSWNAETLTAEIIPLTDAAGEGEILFTANPAAEGLPGLSSRVSFTLAEGATAVNYTISFTGT